MLKKTAVLIVIPLLLSSCSPSAAKIALFKGDGHVALIDTADGKNGSTDLIKMMKRKNSFVFFVSDAGCLSCQAFEKMLTPYVASTALLIYKIGLKIYSGIATSDRTAVGLPAAVATPTLFFVTAGAVTDYISYNDDPKAFTETQKFEKLLKKYCVMTDIVYKMPFKEVDGLTAYMTDSFDQFIGSDLTGKFALYETLSGPLNDWFIGRQDTEDWSAKDITGLLTSDNMSIDPLKAQDVYYRFQIPEDYDLPVLLTLEKGVVRSVEKL